ncbi:MAG: septum formation initiator family protein [Candidatus Microgenomates bacterium]|jgi:cell division protein FtsB
MEGKIIEGLRLKGKKILGYAIWVLVAILLLSTVRNIQKVIAIRAEVEKERQKVSKMEADNAALQAQIAQTQGSEYIEKQIRDKLGLVKRGEAIVILPDDDTLRKLAPPEPTEEETLPDPNWKKWEKLFF